MFNTNLHIASILQLPVGLRQAKTIAWAKTLTKLVKDLMAAFTAYRSEKLFLLAHNSQIIYLEHILNFYFNPALNSEDPDYVGNGIYITDAADVDAVYVFNPEEEAEDMYLYGPGDEPYNEVYLYDGTDFEPLVGFIVNVPTAFAVDVNRLKAMINSLRLAGKLYTINQY